MPYKIIKKNNKFVVINETTGAKRGTHDSYDKAVAQMRLLYGIEKGTIKKRRK